MKKELPCKQSDEFLTALQARFDANKARHPGFAWAKLVVLNPNGIPSLSPGLVRSTYLG